MKSGRDLNDTLTAAVIRNLKIVQVSSFRLLYALKLYQDKSSYLNLTKSLQEDLGLGPTNSPFFSNSTIFGDHGPLKASYALHLKNFNHNFLAYKNMRKEILRIKIIQIQVFSTALETLGILSYFSKDLNGVVCS